MIPAVTAYVLLEDGTRFDGLACGVDAHAVGEIVFTTAMSGYQEAMTDPSYAGQLIAFTYPQIGNYGVSEQAMESDRVHARAAIMRAAVDRADAPGAQSGWTTWLAGQGIPAITDLDTRALVRHIRDRGAMRGGVFPAQIPERRARELIDSEPSMTGRDLAREVTPLSVITLGPIPPSERLGPGPSSPPSELARQSAQPIARELASDSRTRGAPPSSPPGELASDWRMRIAMIDTGVKRSIVRNLCERGASVELHPCSASPAELLAGAPDAIFLANGPGDPAALDYVVDTVRQLVGRLPVYGICLGHQLLCRAIGLETYKLAFGHHGANHPVKDLDTGRIEITSQNHGFAVLGPGGAKTIDTDAPVRWETAFGAAELSHINLYDRTVEGLTLLDVPGATVQYHPEAGPGPHDSLYLFDRFIQQIRMAPARGPSNVALTEHGVVRP